MAHSPSALRPLALLALALLATPVRAQSLLHEFASPNTGLGFGNAVATVPDLDGDGIDDILVGADSEYPPPSPLWAGRAYVFSGASGALLYELVSPNEEAHGFFGRDVAGIRDLDGDGAGDLIVGSLEDGDNNLGGRVYVFSGASGALLRTLTSPHVGYSRDFGGSVAGVTDLNGDGVDDLLVGDEECDPPPSPDAAGRAYVFSGASGSLLHILASPNEESFGFFGRAVAGVTDLDGDGAGDLLVGAPWEEDGPSEGGSAYVFSGASSTLLHAFLTPDGRTQFGRAVTGVADLDGDGVSDLLVGANGATYAYSGASSLLLHTLISPNEEMDGLFGWSVSGVPDLNGDGVGDLAIGAPSESPAPSPKRAGRAYVFSGASGAPLYEFAAPAEVRSGEFGFDVAGTSDLDGDGRGDLLVGGPGVYLDSGPSGARAFAFSTAPVPFALAAEPLNSPVARGDSLRLRLTLTNDHDERIAGALHLIVDTPGGQRLAYERHFPVGLAAGETVTPTYRLPVPENALTGLYTGFVKGYGNGALLGSAAFSFEVVTAGGEAACNPCAKEDLSSTELAADAERGGANGAHGAPALRLDAPAPNPAAGAVTLRYSLPEQHTARLAVYDLLGREVAVLADGPHAAGTHAAVLADDLPTGVYLVRLVVGERSLSQRLTLLR